MHSVVFSPAAPLIVAEIGMTHDGSLGLAKQLTRSAIACGARVVKYQMHMADAETLRDAPAPHYFTGESRHAYFTRTAFTDAQFSELLAICRESSVFSCISAFSLESVDRIQALGTDIIKIPSGEVSNIPLLRRAAATRLPVILSSGMSSWHEIDTAVGIFEPTDQFCLVQCASLYPCPPEAAGLNVITEMIRRYGRPVGLSDHTLSTATAVAAVVLGAAVLEKHFTLSKELYGPDARFSLEPDEFRRLVQDVDFVARALASPVDKDDVRQYDQMREVFTKSIVVKSGLAPGETVTIDRLAFKKPGTGISAAEVDRVLGQRVRRALAHDELLRWEDLEP